MADSTRRGFVTGGTWCVDINKVVSHWPQEDGLAEYLGEERANGHQRGDRYCSSHHRLPAAAGPLTIHQDRSTS